ncbi:MAG: flippase-like domain-containing protein [Clostridia bacterium]|nr:flippase-like domain-containing protein [Clostridia bacterium]
MKLRYRIIFFLIGLAGMGVMLWQSDIANTDWDNLLTPKTLLFLAGLLGLWLTIYIVHVACYYVILGRDGKKVPAFSMFKICFSGFALNSVTPAGLVGGEPYRIMALKKYCSIEKASSSTLTFSLFYIVGHVTIWFTGAVVYFALGLYGDTVIDVLLIITALGTTAFLFAFFISKRRGLVRPFMAFLTKIPFLKKPMKRVYDKNLDSYREIDANIKAFRATRARFWTVFFLQYFSRVLECVEYFLIFLYLGQEINVFGGILILTMASLVGNIMFLIPMQAGSREGGMALSLAFLGISSGYGVQGGLIFRARDFICIIIGISLIMFDRKKIRKNMFAPDTESTTEKIIGAQGTPPPPLTEPDNLD